MYDLRGLVDLGSPEVKSADKETNVEGTVLQVQKKEGSCRLDYQHVSGLSKWIGVLVLALTDEVASGLAD
jgi:hypothetical protein